MSQRPRIALLIPPARVPSMFTDAALGRLAGLRRPHEMDAAIKRGADWRTVAAAYPAGHTLAGRAVGVVGSGYVGRKVVGLLGALGAHVSVYDPLSWLARPSAMVRRLAGTRV